MAEAFKRLAEKRSLRNALIAAYILLILSISATVKAADSVGFKVSKESPVLQSIFLDPLPVIGLSTVAAPEIVCESAQ